MKPFLFGLSLILVSAGPLLAQQSPEAAKLKERFKELESQAAQAKENGETDKLEKYTSEMAELKARIAELEAKGRDLKQERTNEKITEKIKEKTKEKPKEERIRGRAKQKENDEDRSMVLIEKIGHLRREAVRAKRAGDLDRAKESWAEADRLDAELRLEGDLPELPPPGPGQGPAGELVLRRAAEMRQRGEEMAQEGRRMAEEMREQARSFREKAKGLSGQGDPRDLQHELQREAEGMRSKAEALARDYRKKGEQFRRDAERLEREGGRLERGPPQPGEPIDFAPPPPGPPRFKGGPVGPPVPGPRQLSTPEGDDLRGEVDRLRKEIRELRDLLNRSLKERPAPRSDEKSFR
jgi:hypothetical protein